MKKKILPGIISIILFLTTGMPSVFAASNEDLEARVNALKKALDEKSSTGIGQISDRFTLFGAVELDYSYADDQDTSSNTSNQSTSDLDVGTVELGLEAALHEYVTANLLLKGENLDSDDNVFWDEAFFTIQKQDFPLYFVGGKRVQPFGVFESLFITDPVTCDLYEINKTGATVGVIHEPFGIDLSATIYKGETLINKVDEAGYGFSRSNTTGYTETDNMESYILNITLSPVENLTVSAYFNSEPGDGDRNSTAGISAHYEIADFIIDGEYIGAVNREKHFTDTLEYKESAFFVSLGYRVTDPLLVAVRYEGFDDDQSGDQDEHLDCRYSLGASYTLFEDDNFACRLSGEYRATEYEHVQDSGADDGLNEFFARLAIEF